MNYNGELPPNFEHPTPVERTTLTPDLYPENSFGQDLFPEILIGRNRPLDIFNVPIRFGKKTQETMDSHGLESVSDFMILSPSDLVDSAVNVKHVRTKLQRELEHIGASKSLTPHGRLLSAMFGERHGNVVPSDEEAIINTVNDAVANNNRLTERERVTLDLRFGLTTWQPMFFEEVAKKFGIHRERVRQIELGALSKLRYPNFLDRLSQLRTTPDVSVGRILGIVKMDDLPLTDTKGNTLGLSEEAQAELQEKTYTFSSRMLDGYRFREFLSAPLPPDISLDTMSELQLSARKFGFLAVFGELTTEIANQQFDQLAEFGIARDTPMASLGLSSSATSEMHRHGIITFGDYIVRRENADERGTQIYLHVRREVSAKTNLLSSYLGQILEQLDSGETEQTS